MPMPAAANDSQLTDVSVVLPTTGLLDQLDSCLDALSRQTLAGDRFEIIVVDDAPDHNTLHLVSGWRARTLERGPRIVYLSNPGPHGPAAARNRGWRVARGAVIAFTDDATIAAPDWLEQGLAALGPHTDVLCGKVAMPLAATPTEYQREAMRQAQADFACANLFCRRRLIDALDGFDERFSDPDCCEKDLHFRLLTRPVAIDRAERAVVTLPLRPPAWGVSVSTLQHQAARALLYKKHPYLYRQQIDRGPPWPYYAITATLLLALAASVDGAGTLALAAWAVWLALTIGLCRQRLRGTSRRPAHVLEIVITSFVIAPLAVFWRLSGALRYRVRFA